MGIPKPWSDDETFRTVYFCNVRREHDRVTRFIRETYSPWVSDRWFEYNIILSRFLNWPPTLTRLGYRKHHSSSEIEHILARISKEGKLWGGAYIITTHGIPMGKAAYLAHNVLGGVASAMESHSWLFGHAPGAVVAGTCSAAHKALQGLEGLGSFLAAQVVADLKNTPGHSLYKAEDKTTFVAHGPGSLRGLQWFWQHEGVTITPSNFLFYFAAMRSYVDENWDEASMGAPICNQDLQNCLCEFDKYMRVSTGTGRSKRKYPGLA